MNEKDFAEFSAGHALNALTPAEDREFEAALAQHPEWVRHVELDIDTAALLAEATTEIAPPAAARAALLAQIARTPPKGTPATGAQDEVPTVLNAAGPATVRRGIGIRGMFTLAASLAIVLGIGAGAVLVVQQVTTRSSAVVALDQIEEAPDAQVSRAVLSGGGDVTAHWSVTLDKAVIVSEGLPSIPSSQTFEVWFVRGTSAIPAGTFAADEAGRATSELAAGMQPGDVIAITVEQAGGSPMGVPTTTPIVAIPTA